MRTLQQRVGMLAAVGILALLTLLVPTSFPGLESVFGQSSIVELQVPETQIIVQGSSSPDALIRVLQDGTETASTTANSMGAFIIPITDLGAGIYSISVQATDTSGNQTPLITRDIAVNLQQSSVVTFFMPPTISISEPSLPFGQRSFVFEAQGTPGATIQLTIGNGRRTLSATADANGRATFSLRSDSLSVGIFSYKVEASLNNQTSEPDTTVRNLLVTPPIIEQQPIINTAPAESTAEQDAQASALITSPLNGVTLPGADLLIAGSAPSGNEILLYVDGILTGAVVSGQTGEWQFYFLPFSNRHVFSTQTCSEGICSDISGEIEVFFEEIAGVCDLNFDLEAYRISGFTNNQVEIRSSEQLSADSAEVHIYWGESASEQRFSLKNNEPLKGEYSYQSPGLYNGYVIISDSNNCSTQKYFTAQIRGHNESNYFGITLVLFVLFLAAIVYLNRFVAR